MPKSSRAMRTPYDESSSKIPFASSIDWIRTVSVISNVIHFGSRPVFFIWPMIEGTLFSTRSCCTDRLIPIDSIPSFFPFSIMKVQALCITYSPTCPTRPFFSAISITCPAGTYPPFPWGSLTSASVPVNRSLLR